MVTPYVARMESGGEPSGLRLRRRGRFEPPPVLPIDGPVPAGLQSAPEADDRAADAPEADDRAAGPTETVFDERDSQLPLRDAAPASAQPASAQPATAQPATAQPATAQPATPSQPPADITDTVRVVDVTAPGRRSPVAPAVGPAAATDSSLSALPPPRDPVAAARPDPVAAPRRATHAGTGAGPEDRIEDRAPASAPPGGDARGAAPVQAVPPSIVEPAASDGKSRRPTPEGVPVGAGDSAGHAARVATARVATAPNATLPDATVPDAARSSVAASAVAPQIETLLVAPPRPSPRGGDLNGPPALSDAPAEISVSIGTIEVRVSPTRAPASAPSPRGPRRTPQSLDDYLRTRAGGLAR